MEQIKIEVVRLKHAEGLELPEYATSGSAGMDLVSAVETEIKPSEIILVPTGLTVAIPKGYEGQIRPRSGLALKHGITIPNSPGTIDSDYRGEIKIILQNLGSEPFVIKRGDRIAQFVVAPVVKAEWKPVETLPESARSSGGFGHTGK
jgi:dUTP pyrophosphatase